MYDGQLGRKLQPKKWKLLEIDAKIDTETHGTCSEKVGRRPGENCRDFKKGRSKKQGGWKWLEIDAKGGNEGCTRSHKLDKPEKITPHSDYWN